MNNIFLFRLTINSLLHDKEPPVKVEAAIAVQMMLSSKGDLAKKYLEPQIREITLELLKIIRETENDDLTTVMQKITATSISALAELDELMKDNEKVELLENCIDHLFSMCCMQFRHVLEVRL